MVEHMNDMLLTACFDVDMNSVPGWCCLDRLGSTNKQVFGITGEGKCNLDNLRLIREAVKCRLVDVSKGNLVSDPLKVFIKQEPHKRKKIEENRLRLIMSVSLIDALVDRLLFMRLMYKVVNNFNKTNVMIGWSPIKGGYRMLDMLFPGKSMSIDKKAWDWSVPGWLLSAVMSVILRLANDAPEWWQTAVRTRFECLFSRPIFKFQDGAEFRQQKPGIMKSGCYLTIFINSVGQLLLHEMAGHVLLCREISEPIIVLGDDTLQNYFPEFEKYVKYLESLGFVCEYEIHEGRREFAGFTYDRDYIPAYKQKHLFALSYLTTDRTIAEQTLQNYQYLYYFEPAMMKLIREMIRILDVPTAYVDDEALRAIALG